MIYVGIDPGTEKSAYIVTDEYEPMYSAKIPNEDLRRQLINANIVEGKDARLIIEVPICRKWAGREVSDTAIWTGIFLASWPDFNGAYADMVTRQSVRMHTVGRKATDASIRKYLIDRFDQDMLSNWFAGFKEDIWQAYALVVTFLDKINAKNI